MVTNPTSPIPTAERADKIREDSKWYRRLYMRWTVVYWVLTLCAAGTAVSAAIKSAYSSMHPVSASGVNAAGMAAYLDMPVIWLAAITVVATALQGVMRADQLADRYRFGDLLLQTAIMKFDFSPRTENDLSNLLAAWEHAQQMLQGGPGALAPKVHATITAA